MKRNLYISLLISFAGLVTPFVAACQNTAALLHEAQVLQDAHNEAGALKKYVEVLKLQPDNLVALCKASELNSLIGNRQRTSDEKLSLFKSARHYAEMALRINPNHSEANFVMAMAMGRMALVLSGKEKIVAVNEIKKYAELAVRNDPRNFKAYHVLGKWHYEVSSLTGFERLAAKVFFGGLPASSFAESIKNYEKSRSLSPDFALNYLEVAKAYQKNQENSKAVEVLKKLQAMPVKHTDDPRIKKEGKELLAALSK